MVLAAAIGAVAVMALSGLALAHGRHGGERHRHGADTGTIASFDQSTGMLAIQLSGEGGAAVSGVVTRHTKIRCEDEHTPAASSRALRRSDGGSGNSGPGNSGSSDNSGREPEPGDDNGGHGNEPGDDHGATAEPGNDNGGASGGDNGARGASGNDDNGAGANCTTSDLIAGAVVHEAELDLRNGQAVWDEVELNG
jgi:hypothetical protein